MGSGSIELNTISTLASSLMIISGFYYKGGILNYKSFCKWTDY